MWDSSSFSFFFCCSGSRGFGRKWIVIAAAKSLGRVRGRGWSQSNEVALAVKEWTVSRLVVAKALNQYIWPV